MGKPWWETWRINYLKNAYRLIFRITLIFSLILVGKSRRELTRTIHMYELEEDSLYVEFVDKYKSNMESDHGDDIFHFHVYILDFSFWLLRCWCSCSLWKKSCKHALVHWSGYCLPLCKSGKRGCPQTEWNSINALLSKALNNLNRRGFSSNIWGVIL